MKKSIQKVLATCTAVAALTATMGTAALAADLTYENNTLTGYDVPAGMEDKQVTILVVPHDATEVTDENIFFIDQNKGGSFVVKPKVDSNNVLADGKYDVRIGGEGIAATDIVITEFEIKDGKLAGDSPIVKYILGDVNNDQKINAADINEIVAHILEYKELVDTAEYPYFTAADVQKNGNLNAADINEIVAHILGYQPIVQPDFE